MNEIFVEIIENYTYRVTNAISCSCWTMWSGVTPSAGWFWGRGWGRGWWGPGAVASVWPTSGGIALGVTYAIPRHTGAMIGIIPPDTALGYWGIVRGVPLWFGCWFVSYHGRWTGCSCLWSGKKKIKIDAILGVYELLQSNLSYLVLETPALRVPIRFARLAQLWPQWPQKL